MPDELLFDLATDPHEQHDLTHAEAAVCAGAGDLMAAWRADALTRSCTGIDPLDVALQEGGPWHVRGRLLEYAERLRATGRGEWADTLLARYPREASGELPRWRLLNGCRARAYAAVHVPRDGGHGGGEQ